MFRFLCIVIPIFFSYCITAQDAYHQELANQLSEQFNLVGGTFLLDDTEAAKISNTISYGNLSVSGQNDTENPFNQFLSINVIGEGANPWDAGINIRNQNTVARNDVVLAVFWMRGESSVATPQVNFFVEESATFDKEIFITVEPPATWTQYIIPFKAVRDYPVDNIVTGLHLAFAAQKIEFGGLALINYEDKYVLQDLPTQLGTGPYAGSEADAAWRADAASRIEELRMAQLELLVLDKDDQPLKNTTVHVAMQKHDFEFGTAVVASRFANNRDYLQIYENKLLDLDGRGHGFNTVVFENSLKWRAWEGEWPTNKSEKVKAIQWLVDNDITIRGHNLIWPSWDFLPDYMESNRNNPSFLVDQVQERIETILNTEGIKGNIKDWDVINEIAVSTDLADALRGSTGYVTGREIYAEMFQQVKEIDPEITTYLNDFITIGQNRENGILYDEYKSHIREIINAGGQIDGIGFQAHIGGSPTPPEKVYRILDDFYNEFGTEAKITEYDTDRLVNGELGAMYMEDFLTIIFSHPSMTGFMMWGFWDGNHWKQNAPIYNQDWSLKPSGEAFINKVYSDWWTEETLVTDDEGKVQLNGFKGKYSVTIEGLDEAMIINLPEDTSYVLQVDLTSSTSELEFENEYALFPNPTEDKVTITNRANDTFAVTITDVAGRKLKYYTGSDSYEIDMSDQLSGVYFANVTQASQTFTKKIFKR